MRFLLRPGWVALVLGVIGFALACYTVLAPWQFGRNAERSATNDALLAAVGQPPAPLGTLVPAGTVATGSAQWRLVTLTGSYQPDAEALIRLRVIEGRPAFEVLTPFRTTDGRLVLVDRGYVRPDGGARVPAYSPPPTGEVGLVARIRLDEADPQARGVVDLDGRRQLYAADSQVLAAATGLPLEPGYLQLVDGQPGGLGTLAVPEPDSGPFLSYAWQWLAFGAMAIFGMSYFIRLELLQRHRPGRGRRAAVTTADAPAEPRAPAEPAPPSAPAAGRRPER